jgi:hypothetical protein
MSDPVYAPLGYVAPMPVYPKSAPVPSRNAMKYDFRTMPIHDGRAISGGATLAKNGFICVRHPMTPVDFDDGSRWQERFLDEIMAYIRDMTGQTDVVANHAAPRSTRFKDSDGTIDFVHNDYTGGSIGVFINELDPDRAEERLAKRFAVYNIWRMVSQPPQSRPIAVCDPTTIAIADAVPSQTYYSGERYEENFLLRYNPAHRWYYFPDMTPDEMIIWTGYDSDPAMPSIVPHAAFDNPACTDPNAIRSNIDTRAYVFFDD